jgi:hypothetical protein
MDTPMLEVESDAAIQLHFERHGRASRALSDNAPTIPETHWLPTASTFFEEHVKKNVPIVIRGGASSWRALEWSAESLACYNDEIVSVAPLEANGPHAFRDKWLEAVDHWDHSGKEPEPLVVDERQLLVVSATRVRMRLKKFFNLLRADSKTAGAATFYADGAGNMEHSFGFLREGFFSPPAFAEALELKRVDLWLGARTVSRMHFDNLDNVFAQVVGSKTFVLARPADGAACQGGKRLRKARQCYTHPGVFSREGGGVMHETVLNYLGVARPPNLPATAVTLSPGDLLYLPFGWWHEVHGHPEPVAGGLCASISHFYEPYYCRLGGKACKMLGPLMVHPRYCKDEGDEDEEPCSKPKGTREACDDAVKGDGEARRDDAVDSLQAGVRSTQGRGMQVATMGSPAAMAIAAGFLLAAFAVATVRSLRKVRE